MLYSFVLVLHRRTVGLQAPMVVVQVSARHDEVTKVQA